MSLERDSFLEVLKRPKYARLFILQRLAESRCIVELLEELADDEAIQMAHAFYIATENLNRIRMAAKMKATSEVAC